MSNYRRDPFYQNPKQKCSRLTCVILMAIIFVIDIAGSVAYGKEFDDTNHWAKNYIDYMTAEEVLVGMDNNTFSPDTSMTRAMFVTALGRMNGISVASSQSSHFYDVPENAYYASYVNWAHSNQIIVGTAQNYFSPNKTITREEAATIIHRMMQYEGLSEENFLDDNEISDYARESVYALVNNQIINGYPDKTFRPQSAITRAEACVILSKMNGKTFELFIPEPQPQLTYIGTYKLTCYCSGCNSPRGSRQTASGAVATAGEYGTIAVHPSMYSKYKPGTVLYIEGVGYRKIQDKHGVSANKIDVYVGEGSCRCSYNVLSGKSAKVYLVN